MHCCVVPFILLYALVNLKTFLSPDFFIAVNCNAKFFLNIFFNIVCTLFVGLLVGRSKPLLINLIYEIQEKNLVVKFFYHFASNHVKTFEIFNY
jgi:hypothetical protein